MKKLQMLVMFLLVFGMVNLAISGVHAYDTFAYEEGPIIGDATSALGFAGEWGAGGGNGSQCSVIGTSLVYPGVDTALQGNSGKFQVIVPSFDGGRAGRFFNTEVDGPFAHYLDGAGNIGRSGTSIYMSFLMKTSHTTPFYAFELKRNDLSDAGAVLYVGNDVGGSDFQVCAYRNRDLSEGNIGVQFNWLGAASTGVELFVVRIDFGSTSDNVTVYRNPSLDEEPVKDPDLQGAGDISFDGISIAAWVDPGGRTNQVDEICVASSYADVVRFYNGSHRVQSPAPADGAVEVATPSVNLSWTAGTAATAAGYKVYFSDSLDDVLAANDAALKGTTTQESMTINSLNTDSTYYWSVYEIAEPNDVPGVVWTFETKKTYPVINAGPDDLQIKAGEAAVFAIDVTSETPESYQWYNLNGIVTDGGKISGAQTATLTISDVQVEDESNYYCEITNNAGTISTDIASLKIKRLIGHWPLDPPTVTDPNTVWDDLSSSDNVLKAVFTVPSEFTFVEGADGTVDGALVFDGQFALGTTKDDGTMNDLPVGNDPYSMMAWFKTSKTDSGLVGWGGFGTNNRTNVLNIQNDGQTIRNYWWDVDLDGSRGYSILNDEWHHAAATYDGHTRKIYIDGIECGSDTPIPHEATNEHFLIGKGNETDPPVAFVNGAMDDVRVYNYALSAIEVAKVYTDMTGGDLCAVPPALDLTNDCRVDLYDLAALAGQWMECGLVPTCITVD